jgi:hypothetical protein
VGSFEDHEMSSANQRLIVPPRPPPQTNSVPRLRQHWNVGEAFFTDDGAFIDDGIDDYQFGSTPRAHARSENINSAFRWPRHTKGRPKKIRRVRIDHMCLIRGLYHHPRIKRKSGSPNLGRATPVVCIWGRSSRFKGTPRLSGGFGWRAAHELLDKAPPCFQRPRGLHTQIGGSSKSEISALAWWWRVCVQPRKRNKSLS